MLPGNTKHLFANTVSQSIESRVVSMFSIQEEYVVGVFAKGQY